MLAFAVAVDHFIAGGIIGIGARTNLFELGFSHGALEGVYGVASLKHLLFDKAGGLGFIFEARFDEGNDLLIDIICMGVRQPGSGPVAGANVLVGIGVADETDAIGFEGDVGLYADGSIVVFDDGDDAFVRIDGVPSHGHGQGCEFGAEPCVEAVGSAFVEAVPTGNDDAAAVIASQSAEGAPEESVFSGYDIGLCGEQFFEGIDDEEADILFFKELFEEGNKGEYDRAGVFAGGLGVREVDTLDIRVLRLVPGEESLEGIALIPCSEDDDGVALAGGVHLGTTGNQGGEVSSLADAWGTVEEEELITGEDFGDGPFLGFGLLLKLERLEGDHISP